MKGSLWDWEGLVVKGHDGYTALCVPQSPQNPDFVKGCGGHRKVLAEWVAWHV